MLDIFDPRKRSEIMAEIKSTGTAPELRLQQMVRAILGPAGASSTTWTIYLGNLTYSFLGCHS